MIHRFKALQAAARHCHALMLKGAAMSIFNAKQGAALSSFFGHTRLDASWQEGQPGFACT